MSPKQNYVHQLYIFFSSYQKHMWGKRKNYMITFWTHEYPKELPDNSTYLCTCEDTCENGRYHGHVFFYFKNPEDMKYVKS